MTYRDAPPLAPEGKVVHGPFPVRLGRVAMGMLFLTMAPVFLGMALDDARLECDRARDRCRYEGSVIFSRPEAFKLGQLKGVRVEIEHGSKNTRYGVPYLDLSGRELRLARVDPDEANRFAADLRRALADKPARIHLELEATRAFLFPAVMFLVLAASALFAGLRRIGRIVFRTHGGQLELARRALGVTLWRAAFDLRGVTDVEVEWERRTSFYTAKYSAGDTYGRLVLVRGAERELLTTASYPGFHLHRRAERELRDLLMLSPRAPERESALASVAAGYEPAQVMGGGLGATIGLVWIGVCTGALLSLPICFLLLLPFGVGRSPPDWVFTVGAPSGSVLGVLTAFYLRRRASSR